MPRDRTKSGCTAFSRGAYPFFGNRLKRGHGFAISVAGPPAPPAGSASRKDHAASSAEAEELNDKPRDTPFLPAALVERFDDLSDRIAISPCNRDETHHQPKKAGSWRVSCYMSGIPVLTVPSGFFYSCPVATQPGSGRKPGPLQRGPIPMSEVGGCFIGALKEVEQHCIG
jgi:hypothetical protein